MTDLCVHKFFHEQKKHAFLQKNMRQNRYPWGIIQNRLERFSSRKKREKHEKNMFAVYGWASKSLKNDVFSCKIIIMLTLKNHYFSPCPVYRWCKRSHKKSFIFNVKSYAFFTCKICIFIAPGM